MEQKFFSRLALGIIVLAFAIIKILRDTVVKNLKKWPSRTSNTFDDFIVHAIEKSVVSYS